MNAKRALYFLIAINLLMLFGLGYAYRDVQLLQDSDTVSNRALRIGCERANSSRGVQVFILQQLNGIAKVVAEFSITPEISGKFKRDLPKYEKKLASLRVKAEAHPDPKNPYLVNCDEAYPK